MNASRRHVKSVRRIELNTALGEYVYAVDEQSNVATSTAKTNAERQRDLRNRRKTDEAMPTTEVRGIYAHPDDHAEVKEAAAKIARRRQRVAKRAAP